MAVELTLSGIPVPRDQIQRVAQALAESYKQFDTLRTFAPAVYPGFRWYRWLEAVAEHLEAIASGDLTRLMIYAPPRHGKTQLTSKIFPAYYLHKKPGKNVGLASYSADLAYVSSRAVRDFYVAAGNKIRGDASAVKHWETEHGGEVWACGVGGPATGKGYHLGVRDDPIKNAEEAASATIRERHKNWEDSTWNTRAEPDAARIDMQTRWDDDDLGGYMLKKEEESLRPEGWTILCYEAIKSRKSFAFPESCTLIPDFREAGEALCPERFPVDRLEQIRANMLAYWWNCLYGQRPEPGAGRGRIYYNFDSELNISEDAKDHGGTLEIGMDFNVNPMTATVGVTAGNEPRQFDEVVIPDSGTEEMCQEIKRRFPEREVVVYPDPSGGSKRTSGKTDFAIIREHGFKIDAPAAAPALTDRYNNTNLLFKDGAGKRRLLIHPRCKHSIQARSRFTYKPGTGVPDKGRWDHMCDAADYWLWSAHPAVSAVDHGTSRLPI